MFFPRGTEAKKCQKCGRCLVFCSRYGGKKIAWAAGLGLGRAVPGQGRGQKGWPGAWAGPGQARPGHANFFFLGAQKKQITAHRQILFYQTRHVLLRGCAHVADPWGGFGFWVFPSKSCFYPTRQFPGGSKNVRTAGGVVSCQGFEGN